MLKSCPVRNEAWKDEESLQGVRAQQDKAVQVRIGCSDLCRQIPNNCFIRLPGPIRGAIAPHSSFLLILPAQVTNMNYHVHDSKLPAKTEEISKGFENAGHFFL